jgi:regulator of replication initiation timing
MYEKLEELRREVARLSAELEMFKAKVRVCLEATARLNEELERLKRKSRRFGLRRYIEALKAYDGVDMGEQEPP